MSVFKLGLEVVVSVFFSAVEILMNKHLIWVFRELVSVLLSNLEEGSNVDTISGMINHELDHIIFGSYFLFSFFVNVPIQQYM